MEDLYDLSNVVKTIVDESDLSECNLNDFIPAEGPLKLSPDKFVSLITDVKSIRDANVNVYQRFVEENSELFTISLTNSVDLIEEFMRYFDISAEVVTDKFRLYKENPLSIPKYEGYPTISKTEYGVMVEDSLDYGYHICFACIKYNDEYGIQKLLSFYPRTIELLVRLRKLCYLRKYVSRIINNKKVYTDTHTNIAAENGDIECLQWLIANGAPIGENIYCYAAHYGQLECIKWLNAAKYPWSENTLLHAEFYGDLKCFKYVFENMPKEIYNHNVCATAASRGHIECLKWAIENGLKCSVAASAYAAQNGHLECLKYLHTNGIKIHSQICEYAAYNKTAECLCWAHKNGYEMFSEVYSIAERHGNLECIRYAYENGVVWRKPDIGQSLYYGRLEIIKYIYEKGIYTNKVYINIAAQHLHVLKWLHESKLIRFDKEYTFEKVDFDELKTECAEYLLQHGLIKYTTCHKKDKFKLFAAAAAAAAATS